MNTLHFYNNDWEPTGMHHESPNVPAFQDIVVLDGAHYTVRDRRFVFFSNHIPARPGPMGQWPASEEYHTRVEIRIDPIASVALNAQI